MGKEVSVDSLEALYRTGRVDLPTGAQQYSGAAAGVNGTAAWEGDTFYGMLGTSPVAGPFTALRDLVQDQILVRTQQAIVKSGKTLADIAVSLGETDKDGAERLEKVKKELDTGLRVDEDGKEYPVDKDNLPPKVDDAPTSGNEQTDPGNEKNNDKPDVNTDPEKGTHGVDGGDAVPKNPGGETKTPDHW